MYMLYHPNCADPPHRYYTATIKGGFLPLKPEPRSRARLAKGHGAIPHGGKPKHIEKALAITGRFQKDFHQIHHGVGIKKYLKSLYMI